MRGEYGADPSPEEMGQSSPEAQENNPEEETIVFTQPIRPGDVIRQDGGVVKFLGIGFKPGFAGYELQAEKLTDQENEDYDTLQTFIEDKLIKSEVAGASKEDLLRERFELVQQYNIASISPEMLNQIDSYYIKWLDEARDYWGGELRQLYNAKNRIGGLGSSSGVTASSLDDQIAKVRQDIQSIAQDRARRIRQQYERHRAIQQPQSEVPS